MARILRKIDLHAPKAKKNVHRHMQTNIAHICKVRKFGIDKGEQRKQEILKLFNYYLNILK